MIAFAQTATKLSILHYMNNTKKKIKKNLEVISYTVVCNVNNGKTKSITNTTRDRKLKRQVNFNLQYIIILNGNCFVINRC